MKVKSQVPGHRAGRWQRRNRDQVCTHASCPFSRVRFFVTPRTVALQAPLSTGFSRQEYRSGLLLPPSGGLGDSKARTLTS